jgi:hypothetical protein
VQHPALLLGVQLLPALLLGVQLLPALLLPALLLPALPTRARVQIYLMSMI